MAYLYPNLKSKAAYKRAIAEGKIITACGVGLEPSPPRDGTVIFEGPHFPEPHRFYGKATIKDGHVIAVQ